MEYELQRNVKPLQILCNESNQNEIKLFVIRILSFDYIKKVKKKKKIGIHIFKTVLDFITRSHFFKKKTRARVIFQKFLTTR